MLKPILILILAGLFATQCTRKKLIGEDEYANLSYRQTQCSDAWGYGANDTETLNRLKHYLDSANLYVADISIRENADADLCQACPCKTSKTIYVTTLGSDALVEKYKDLGFK